MQNKIERKKKPFHFQRSNFQRKSKRKEHISYFKPEIVPALKNVLERIGKPHPTPFVPDDFQLNCTDTEAYRMIGNGVSVPVGTWLGGELNRYFN